MIAWLVETLVATSLLLALVLLLREPVRRSFGAKAAYALWLLPALRMVMPPIANLMPQLLPVPALNPASGALAQLVHARVMPIETAPTFVAEEAAGVPWLLIVLSVWLAGALVFVAWQVAAYYRFRHHVLTGARPRRSPARGIRLLASPQVEGPMAFGIRRRFIVFPQDALIRFDVEEHAMALAHELAHHRRGDLIANVAALGMLALHWCNPLAWYAHRAFRTDQEMACDADVIGAVREAGLGHAYARALVKCAGGRGASPICHLNAVDRLKRRLSMLSKRSPSARRRLVGAAFVGTIAAGGLALTASGQGMAAQVGTQVSEALPIPHMPALRHAFPTVLAVHAASAPEEAEHTDPLAATVEAQGEAGDLRPAPPVPPLAAVAPLPPQPPAPPQGAGVTIPPVPPVPPVPVFQKRIVRIDNGRMIAIPSQAEINAMVPAIELTEGKDCAGQDMVNTSEERVTINGTTRQKIRIHLCNRAVAREGRQEAIRGLELARSEIARQADLSARLRDRITADLDRQLARLRATDGD